MAIAPAGVSQASLGTQLLADVRSPAAEITLSELGMVLTPVIARAGFSGTGTTNDVLLCALGISSLAQAMESTPAAAKQTTYGTPPASAVLQEQPHAAVLLIQQALPMERAVFASQASLGTAIRTDAKSCAI